MEFLRFGSSIPGSYWGCCACDIIQNFHGDPDAKASIEIVGGDGGHTTGKFVGKTEREIFAARLRFGTFSMTDMPNHAFIAIMTQNQINGTNGKKWLEILKEHGFEFIRSVDNSVYSGQALGTPTNDTQGHTNHIFMLVRNIGTRALKDPFTPPKAWTDLPQVKTERWDQGTSLVPGGFNSLVEEQHAADTMIWERLGPPKFYTEAELEKEGIPIHYAGVRNKYPQELKDSRLTKKAMEKADKVPSNPNPFGNEASAPQLAA